MRNPGRLGPWGGRRPVYTEGDNLTFMVIMVPQVEGLWRVEGGIPSFLSYGVPWIRTPVGPDSCHLRSKTLKGRRTSTPPWKNGSQKWLEGRELRTF